MSVALNETNKNSRSLGPLHCALNNEFSAKSSHLNLGA